MRRLARALLELGILGAVFGLSKFHAVRHDYDFTGSSRFGWAIAYVAILSVSAYALGLPDLVRRRSVWWSALAAGLLGATGISLVQLFAGDALLPRFVVFGSAGILVPWMVLCSLVSDDGRARAVDRDRVLVVGEPEEGEALRLELELGAERPASVVAVITPASAIGEGAADEPLVDAAITADATVLVLSRAAGGEARIVDQTAVLHASGLRVRSLAAFYEDWLGKLPISELERTSLMFDIGELHRARYGQLKRLLDVLLAAVGLVVLVLTVPLVAAGNLVANRGPLLYRQARVGKDGKQFTILKFRTMTRDPGGGLVNEWTTEDDPRITRFGRALRRLHVDELPQVVNVLRGDLSIVGPRPEQPRYVQELETEIPFYELRHVVRPGLTGWAQVKFGYAGDEHDALEKLQYEFFYLRHQGLALDLRIVARTIRDVFGRGGR
jgi:lipopolysaccharide/colanic/teichoic acid biosynthesis glycosyltransferase